MASQLHFHPQRFFPSTISGRNYSMSRDMIRLMHVLFAQERNDCEGAPWCPPADIYHSADGSWVVKFELAGVRPEDLSLTAEGHRLSLRGLRRDHLMKRGFRYYRMEIAYNQFERNVELPCDVEHASIATEYSHGMLLVHITPEAQQ
jgi:HSP20 family protein